LCDAGRVWLWKLNSISSACTLHMISIFYGNRYQGLELVTVLGNKYFPYYRH